MAAKTPNLKNMTAVSLGKLVVDAVDQHDTNMWEALNKVLDNVCIHETHVRHDAYDTITTFEFDCTEYGSCLLTTHDSKPGYDVALYVPDVDNGYGNEWHNREHVDKLSDIPKALNRLIKVRDNPAKLIKKLKATAITEDMGCEYREHAIYNASRYELYLEQQIAKALPDMSRPAGCQMHLSNDINDPDFTPEFGIEFNWKGVRFNLRICDGNMYLRDEDGDCTEYDVTFKTLKEVAEKILKKAKSKTETAGKKYEFTGETIEVGEHTLHRIRAVRDIIDPACPDWEIDKGVIGGFIESEDNLSHEGAAWVDGDAKVFGNAKVYGDSIVCGVAEVFGDAEVYDNATVSGRAKVYGNAKVYGKAMVCVDAKVYDNAKVYEDADIRGDSLVYGNAEVCGDTKVCGVNVCEDADKQDLPTKIAETFKQMAVTGSETKVTQRELDAYNDLLETLIKAEVPSATNIKRETLDQLELYTPVDEDECDHRIYFTYDGIPFRIKSLGNRFWVGAGVKCPDDPKTYYGEVCSSSEDTLANLGHIVPSLAAEWKRRYTPANIPNDYDYDGAAKGKATDKNGQPSSDGDRLSQLETKVETLAADMVDAQAKVKKIAKDMKGALSDIKSIKKKLKM